MLKEEEIKINVVSFFLPLFLNLYKFTVSKSLEETYYSNSALH